MRSEDSVITPFHGESLVGPAPAGPSGQPLDGRVLDFIDQEEALVAKDASKGKNKSYRIRRRSGKLAGPYDVQTLIEMLRKQELQGTEEASEDGAVWKTLSTIPVFADEIQRMLSSALGELDEESVFPSRAVAPALSSGRSAPPSRETASTLAKAKKPTTQKKGRGKGLAVGVVLVLLVGGAVAMELLLPDLGALGRKPLMALLGVGESVPAEPAHKPPPPRPAQTKPPASWQNIDVNQLLSEDNLAAYEEAQRKLTTELAAGNLSVALPLARAQVLPAFLDGVTAGAADALRSLEQATGADPKAVAAVKVYAHLAQSKPEDAVKVALEAASGSAPELKELPESARAAMSDLQTAAGYALLAKKGSKLEEALQRFDWALMASPQNLLATLGQAQALMAAGDMESAQGYLVRAVDMQKENLRSRLRLGELLVKNGKAKEAKEHLRMVVGPAGAKGSPAQRATANIVLADVAVTEKDFKQAAEYLGAAAAEQPDDLTVKLRSGELLLRLREWPQARAAFDEVLAKQPGQEVATIGSARAKMGATDVLGAYKQLEEATAKHPQSAALRLWFGKASDALGKSQDALAQYKRAQTLDPKSAAPTVEIAQVLISDRKFTEAVNLLQEARGRVAPEQENLLRAMLGQIYVRQRKYNLAFTEFEAALAQTPGNHEARARYGAALRDVRRYEQAYKHLQAAMVEDPRNALILAEMGSYHVTQGRLDKAIPLFAEAIRISPKEADFFVRMGAATFMKGDNAGALEFLRQAQTLSPSNPGMFFWMGLVTRERGDKEKAKTLLKQGMELAPEDERFDHEMGRTFLNEGSYVEALDFFRSAVRKNPSNGEAHHDLGKCLEEQTRYSEARVAFQEAAKLLPHNGQVRLRIADTYAKTGDYSQAAKEYQKALVDDPTLSEAYCKLGDVFRTDGKYKQAAAKYERCLQQLPEHKDAWKWLGYTYESMGSRFNKKALAAWSHHVKLHPGDADSELIKDKIAELKGQ